MFTMEVFDEEYKEEVHSSSFTETSISYELVNEEHKAEESDENVNPE